MIREAIKSMVKTPGKAPPTDGPSLVSQLEAKAAEASANLEQARALYAEAALAAAEGQAVDPASARKAVEAAQDAHRDAEAALQAAKARQAKADAERAAKARAKQLSEVKAAAKARIEAVEALHQAAEPYAAAHAEYLTASGAFADLLKQVGLYDKFAERLNQHYHDVRAKLDLKSKGVEWAYKLPLGAMHYVQFVQQMKEDTDLFVAAAVKKLAP